MISKQINKFFFILLIFLYSCGGIPEALKPKKVEKGSSVNAFERARKNVEEGRGVSLKGAMSKNKSSTYEFSTSNPLWRATLETLDFMPLATVDYSGGMIITDWYNDSNNANDSIKITLRFLSNEVRSDSIKVIVHNKNCKSSGACTINEIDSNIKFELQKSILSKAAKLEKESKNKK